MLCNFFACFCSQIEKFVPILVVIHGAFGGSNVNPVESLQADQPPGAG